MAGGGLLVGNGGGPHFESCYENEQSLQYDGSVCLFMSKKPRAQAGRQVRKGEWVSGRWQAERGPQSVRVAWAGRGQTALIKKREGAQDGVGTRHGWGSVALTHPQGA